MRWGLLVCSTTLALLCGSQASAQVRIITGRVTDSISNEIVTSGQVSVVGSTVGTTIKDDGTFTLGAPTGDVTLSIRRIGFKRRDVTVPTSQNHVEVGLAWDSFQLEAIVVPGRS